MLLIDPENPDKICDYHLLFSKEEEEYVYQKLLSLIEKRKIVMEVSNATYLNEVKQQENYQIASVNENGFYSFSKEPIETEEMFPRSQIVRFILFETPYTIEFLKNHAPKSVLQRINRFEKADFLGSFPEREERLENVLSEVQDRELFNKICMTFSKTSDLYLHHLKSYPDLWALKEVFEHITLKEKGTFSISKEKERLMKEKNSINFLKQQRNLKENILTARENTMIQKQLLLVPKKVERRTL